MAPTLLGLCKSQLRPQRGQYGVEAVEAEVAPARKLPIETLAGQTSEQRGAAHAALSVHNVAQRLQKDLRPFLLKSGVKAER